MNKAKIELIEKYRFDGYMFDSLSAIRKYVENKIGNIIDSTPNRLKPADALAVFDAIIKNRKELVHLLSVEYLSEGELQPKPISIFDI